MRGLKDFIRSRYLMEAKADAVASKIERIFEWFPGPWVWKGLGLYHSNAEGLDDVALISLTQGSPYVMPFFSHTPEIYQALKETEAGRAIIAKIEIDLAIWAEKLIGSMDWELARIYVKEDEEGREFREQMKDPKHAELLARIQIIVDKMPAPCAICGVSLNDGACENPDCERGRANMERAWED